MALLDELEPSCEVDKLSTLDERDSSAVASESKPDVLVGVRKLVAAKVGAQHKVFVQCLEGWLNRTEIARELSLEGRELFRLHFQGICIFGRIR